MSRRSPPGLPEVSGTQSAGWLPAVTRLSLAAGLIALLAVAVTALGRPGFLPDEEITFAVVDGLAQRGAPVLPSGLSYLRGVGYSYAARLAAVVSGGELPAYRAVSLLCTLLSIVLVYRIGHVLRSPSAGMLAAALFVWHPLTWQLASVARFYAAFQTVALVAILLTIKARDDGRAAVPAIAAIALARLFHEQAALLVLWPLACLLLARGADERRRLAVTLAGSVTAVLLMDAAIRLAEMRAVQAWAGEIGRSMFVGLGIPVPGPTLAMTLVSPWNLAGVASVLAATAFVLWRATRAPVLVVAALAAGASVFHVGAMLAIGLVGIAIRPAQARRVLLATGGLLLASLMVWAAVTVAVSDAAPRLALPFQLALHSAGYPWEAARYLLASAGLLSMAAVAAAAVVANTDWPRPHALVVFAVLVVLALGGSAIEFQDRYFVLVAPLTCLVIAMGLDLVAAAWPGSGRRAVALCLVLLIVGPRLLAFVRDGVPRRDPAGAAAFTPELAAWLRDAVAPGRLVVCNDELACSLALGRVDIWFVPTPSIVEQYAVTGTNGMRGVYAGARVAASEADLGELTRCAPAGVAVVVLDTGKFDYLEARRVADLYVPLPGARTSRLGDRHLVVNAPGRADCHMGGER